VDFDVKVYGLSASDPPVAGKTVEHVPPDPIAALRILKRVIDILSRGT
jgi:hypothetical protein